MNALKPHRKIDMSHDAERIVTPFYGWYVVLGAFAVTLVGFGSAYTFGAFIGSLEHDFHASRGSVSLVFSLAGFLYFGFGIFSGPLADRFGARMLAFLGMLVTGAGLILAGLAQSLTGVYAAYSLGIGLGVGLSYVPVLGAVQRWFVRRRGLASGLAVSGIGIGTLVMPPLATFLVSSIGWRHAYFVLGILAAVVGGGFALLLANDPQERGQAPDGDAIADRSERRPASGVSIRTAVTSRRFIGLYIACLIGSFGLFVPFVHLVPFALDHGIAPSTAALLLGVVGIGSTGGRFILGGIADKMERLMTILVMFAGIAGSMVIWILSKNVWTLGLFSLVFGVFYGGYVALLPAVVMDSFGGKNVSALIGILYTSVAFGTLIGPSVAGFAFDLTHSYTAPILACALTSLMAVAILALTSRASIPLHEMETT